MSFISWTLEAYGHHPDYLINKGYTYDMIFEGIAVEVIKKYHEKVEVDKIKRETDSIRTK